jgi:hypothetical protein
MSPLFLICTGKTFRPLLPTPFLSPTVSTIHPGDEDYEGEYSMQHRLNYGQLIQYYVETFARTDPKVALRYLFLVRDVKTKHGMNLFLRGTADVVMESKQVRGGVGGTKCVLYRPYFFLTCEGGHC